MSDAALRALYERHVEPLLATHAAQVETLGKHGLYPIGVFLLAALGLVGAVIGGWPWLGATCAAVMIPTVAVMNVRVPLYQAGGAAFRGLFKQRVVARIVEGVLPGATYDPDLALARRVLADAGLVPTGGAYVGDDLVRGRLGRTPFALGDIRTSAGGRNPGRPFRGLFFHADFNRSLAGRTIALPQGSLPRAAACNAGLEPAALESPEFEALFDVHASDAVEARYVLTPKTMERLVALRRLVGHPVHAAFDRGRLYVAIERGEGAFDALAFGGQRAWEEIRAYAALADTARAIVEELELDTRIWTKRFAPEAEAQAAGASEPSAWAEVWRKGAWAFQPRVPFVFDDDPAPPLRTRVEHARDGLLVRYERDPGPLLVLAGTVAGAACVVLGPPGWPPFTTIADALAFLRGASWPAALMTLSVVATALFVARHRVRWLDARRGRLRTGALGRAPRTLHAPRIARVFATEDLVMARVEGSWIPEPLSPRLGSHGAALWLAAEVRQALGTPDASRAGNTRPSSLLLAGSP